MDYTIANISMEMLCVFMLGILLVSQLFSAVKHGIGKRFGCN
jgi:hypothetical protein